MEVDFLWHRIRRAIEGSPPRVLDFSITHFGGGALQEAWGDFTAMEDVEFSMDTPHITVFMPWFFYEWLPVPGDTAVRPDALDGRTIGQTYLDKNRRHLDPLLVRYIEQCCANPFSFYDVLSVYPGSGITLRDIFTGEEITVTEKSASNQMKEGDILFSKVVKVDHVALLESCAPYMFPPMEKGIILELRNRIEGDKRPLTPQLLREYGYDMLDIYHDIVERLLNPRMPELQNTDGDPLLLHRLVYEIESPRAAFDSLAKLCLKNTADELLADGNFDTKEELCSIEFSWQKLGNKNNKSWDNTILGHIKIDGGSMYLEVNSENRALQIRGIIEQMLPTARYKTTVIQSIQAMLAENQKEGVTTSSLSRQKELDDLNDNPEIEAEITEYMRQHFRKWPKMKLPALNDKTPLQSIKTRDGREMVEALLLDIERRSQQATPPLDPTIFVELREKLGL